MKRVLRLTVVLLAIWAQAWAQQAPAQAPATPAASAPTSPEPLQITGEDGALWERYQLLSRLSAAQLELMRLQNEKTLAEEYAKLDARFRLHYKLSVSEIERKGDQWIPRTAPPQTPK